MFSICKNFVKQVGTISIDDYVSVIRNPTQEHIEKINLIRSQSDKKIRKKLKKNLNSVLPNGLFSKVCDEGIDDWSGFLYFDIDNLSADEYEGWKQKLSSNVTVLHKSSSGRGMSVLVKVSFELNGHKIDLDTLMLDDRIIDMKKVFFKELYLFVGKLLSIDNVMDTQVGSISRHLYFSYDNNVVYNKDNQIVIKDKDFSSLMGCLKGYNSIITHPIQPFRHPHQIIKLTIDKPIPYLHTKGLKYQNYVENDSTSFTRNYNHKIGIRKKLDDGQKRKTYYRIVLELKYVNNNIPEQQLINLIWSYLFWQNTLQSPHMEHMHLIMLVESAFNDGTPFTPKEKLIDWGKDSQGVDKKTKIKTSLKVRSMDKHNDWLISFKQVITDMENEGLDISNKSIEKWCKQKGIKGFSRQTLINHKKLMEENGNNPFSIEQINKKINDTLYGTIL
jgi:hypothetical protein